MKKSILLIFTILSISVSSNAQIGVNANYDKIKRNIRENQSITYNLNPTRSIYLDEEWIEGNKVDNDLQTIESAHYRYNIYYDKIEMMRPIKPETGEIYSFGGHFFTYEEYLEDDSTTSKGYFEILVYDDCQLLLRREIDVDPGSNEFELYGSSRKEKVLETYYLKFPNSDRAQKIDKDKDQILSVLPRNKEKMQKYLNRHFLLGIWSDKHLKKIVKYYKKKKKNKNNT